MGFVNKKGMVWQIKTKGFKVIQISRKELVEELGQYGAMGISGLQRNCIYRLLHSCTKSNGLPEMLSRMVSSATYYPEDTKVENRNFEFYKNIFGLRQNKLN